MFNCKEFVKADEIAKELSPLQPETVSFLAGRIMLERIHELLEQNTDFIIETTLTTLSYRKIIELSNRKGYQVILLLFWLNNVNLSIKRVKMRVAEGGHNIPEAVIIRCYYKGISNLINVFISLCDYWTVVDNSFKLNSLIAEGIGDAEVVIYNEKIWKIIKTE